MNLFLALKVLMKKWESINKLEFYMKKLLLASAFLALSLPTFADTTGSLVLTGSVLKKMSLLVTAAPAASALNLEASQTDLAVASVNEKSNSNTGYKVTVTSANSGSLKRSGGSEVFTYTMKYNGAAVNLSVANSEVTNVGSAGSVNANKPVTVSYTGVAAEDMVEGVYSDTVTFTIAAN